MSQQEYFAGFYGILIGFTLTELIKGVAETFKNGERIKYYYPHGLAVITIFFLVLLNFFSFFRFVGVTSIVAIQSWTPLILIQSTLIAIILCFDAFLLFPSMHGDNIVDFKSHYFKIIPKIAALIIFMVVWSLFRNIFLDREPIVRLSNIILVFGFIGSFVLLRLRKDWIHYLTWLLLLSMVIYWTFTYKLK